MVLLFVGGFVVILLKFIYGVGLFLGELVMAKALEVVSLGLSGDLFRLMLGVVD